MGHDVDTSLADDELLAFVTDHYRRLVRLAWLVCGDGDDADDAVQGALERAWRNRARLRDPDSLRGWLDRIVVREAIRASTRRRSWLARFVSPARTTDVEVEPSDPRSRNAEVWTDLRLAFDRLTSDQRAVLVLHLHAGYSVAETAVIIGVPAETVRTRLRRARERLRHDLGSET